MARKVLYWQEFLVKLIKNVIRIATYFRINVKMLNVKLMSKNP